MNRRAASLAAAAAALAAAVVLTGCGFQLRGTATYKFSSLYLNSSAPPTFNNEMRRALTGGSSVPLTETAAAAEVILDIPVVQDDKEVLSLSSAGAVREFQLIKRVSFRLHDKDGADWMPAGESNDPALLHVQRDAGAGARPRRTAAAARHADRRHPADRAAPAGRAKTGLARPRRPLRIMQVRAEDLDDHLHRGLAPLYAVHGDEPLLALETGDAIRAAARAAGTAEREVFVVESGFRWDAFLAANNNRGLFGDRKLIDLRIPSGKPGVEGGKALETLAANPNPDNVALVYVAAPRPRDAVVGMVRGAGARRCDHRRLSGRTRRPAVMDCRAHEA